MRLDLVTEGQKCLRKERGCPNLRAESGGRGKGDDGTAWLALPQPCLTEQLEGLEVRMEPYGYLEMRDRPLDVAGGQGRPPCLVRFTRRVECGVVGAVAHSRVSCRASRIESNRGHEPSYRRHSLSTPS